MKVTVELDLNYIEEGMNLDDAVKFAIAEKVSSEISKDTMSELEQRISDKMAEKVDRTIESILDRFMNREILVTDRWGDIQDKFESVTELLKSKFDAFITQPVDDQGRPFSGCSYGKKHTRIEHLIEAKIKEMTSRFTQSILDTVSRKVRDALDENVKEKTAVAMSKVLQLEKILKAD